LSNDQLSEDLARSLHDRVGGLHDAPFTLTDIQGRARGVQRRRRATAAVGIAAAVAVVAAVPMALSGVLDRSDHPQPMPAPAPAPGASVLHDGVVTTADGSTVDLGVDNADVTQLGVLSDGRILVASQAGKPIQVFAADGSPEASYAADYNILTMSATDQVAAWPQDGHVWVLEGGDAEPLDLGRLPHMNGTVLFIDAVTGSDCTAGGCAALLSDGTTTVARMTADGTERLHASEQFRVTDVSPDGATWAVSSIPEEGHQFGCSGLYDPATDEVTARSCAASGLQFSPDGQHLLSARGDNNMAGSADVLDRELKVVRVIDPGPRVVSRAAWADSSHVLVTTVGLDDQQWSLERWSLDDAAPEVVAGPVAGRNPEMLVEFLPSE
jgi:hypothetical protein